MTPGPARVTDGDLQAALWRLLAASDSEDATAFLALLDDAGDAARPRRRTVLGRLAARARRPPRADRRATPTAPPPRSPPPARRWTSARPSPTPRSRWPTWRTSRSTADHVDAAMLLAVDASLLTEQPRAGRAARALHQAHRWLSLTLSGLDLEELAVEHAVRGHAVAAALPLLEDQWRMLLLSAHQHTELAQTLHRRGDAGRAHELAGDRRSPAPRRPASSPGSRTRHAAGPAGRRPGVGADLLRRARRRPRPAAPGAPPGARGRRPVAARVHRPRARPAARAARPQRDGDAGSGEEAVQLLVDAAGAFVAAGDRRRYRQCLLELGRLTADLGRPAEALHWLEAYRADTGRAHARGRQLWAEMFVRRSRLREAERQAALLRRHALEDPLTGLGNRRSAERRLGALRLGEEPLSLAVVDVDRFKEVNDETSHSHGDAVLRRVADLLREHSRTGDEVYRWAGDEFLVVLPTATEEQAVVVMERLRAAVAGADWRDLQVPEPVTVSIGVASAPASPRRATAARVGWRALFDTADLHLFSAKRSGRNRVRAPGGRRPPEDARPGDVSSPGLGQVGRDGRRRRGPRRRARHRPTTCTVRWCHREPCTTG